jgi:hypothetical protein
MLPMALVTDTTGGEHIQEFHTKLHLQNAETVTYNELIIGLTREERVVEHA